MNTVSNVFAFPLSVINDPDPFYSRIPARLEALVPCPGFVMKRGSLSDFPINVACNI